MPSKSGPSNRTHESRQATGQKKQSMQSHISTLGGRSSELGAEEDRFKVEPLLTEQEMEERLEA